MNTNSLITLLSIALPLIGAGVGYFIRHFIEKRREQLSEISRERREHYQLFVDLFIDFLEANGRNADLDVRSQLYEFYKKFILYASPQVIVCFGDFVQSLYGFAEKYPTLESSMELHNAMTRVILYMRKDIGLKNKSLGENGEKLSRGLYGDYDALMKK